MRTPLRRVVQARLPPSRLLPVNGGYLATSGSDCAMFVSAHTGTGSIKPVMPRVAQIGHTWTSNGLLSDGSSVAGRLRLARSRRSIPRGGTRTLSSRSVQSWMSSCSWRNVVSVALDWVMWLLVGAIGGLVAVLAVVAVANAYRRRRRPAAPSPSAATNASSPPQEAGQHDPKACRIVTPAARQQRDRLPRARE
jgi:hypothetical protein